MNSYLIAAALLTNIKTWNRANCPLTNDWPNRWLIQSILPYILNTMWMWLKSEILPFRIKMDKIYDKLNEIKNKKKKYVI